jgi:hypothetical protein
MLDYMALVKRSEQELADCDVALVNLACAAGLPDAEVIDVDACLRRLDEWAEYARRYTERMLPRFQQKPEEFNHSPGYFRTLCMITALQRDLGLRYNPSKISAAVPLDTADTFIHGALLGEGGICASLPVVYAAVGRRLGYPLKLVHAKAGQIGHVFVRWDERGGERFNIEAMSKGLNCYPDDHYRTGVYAISPEVERAGCLLQSLNRREELAGFLAERGCRWRDFGRLRQAANSIAWATAVAPQNAFYLNSFKAVMKEWGMGLEKIEPPGFPAMYFTWPPRRFPEALPLNYEKDVLCLEATENILKNPDWNSRWWEPLRRGLGVGRKPTAAVIVCKPDSCEIGLRFSGN